LMFLAAGWYCLRMASLERSIQGAVQDALLSLIGKKA